MQNFQRVAVGVSAILAASGAVSAQDSVSATPGNVDALSAYVEGAQTINFVVDLVPMTSSWSNGFAIAPVLKTSADPDPLFDTQLVGAVALSPDLRSSIVFGAPQDYLVWTSAGPGIHPAANSAAGMVSVNGFDHQFGLSFADLSAGPTNAVGATIGFTNEPNRLYVSRTIGLMSRFNAVTNDFATLSLGAIDAHGNMTIRADEFNATDPNAVVGDNIVQIDLGTRAAGVNTPINVGGNNIVTDAPASSYLVNDSAVTLNTPSALPESAGVARGAILDFAGNSISATPGSSTTTAAHLDAALSAHRGNPYVSTAASEASFAGYFTALGKVGATGPTDSLNIAQLLADGSVQSTLSRTLPSPISDGAGFTANMSGDAQFTHYLSQESFRGSNGQVAVGVDSITGFRIAAATATDPATGEFIAVVNITGNSDWTVAAHVGKSVLDGENGSPIGAIASSAPASISAPGIDLGGNIYFIAAFQPTVGPEANALIKAVNTASGYQLELIVAEGDSITGANSATAYTIDRITLADSDSVASGSFFASSVLQNGPGGSTFGGAAFGAQITYDNAGTPETYDTVLFVANDASTTALCLGDCDASGTVDFNDLVSMLFLFGTDPGDACDADESGGVDFNDLVTALFLFGPCP